MGVQNGRQQSIQTISALPAVLSKFVVTIRLTGINRAILPAVLSSFHLRLYFYVAFNRAEGALPQVACTFATTLCVDAAPVHVEVTRKGDI